jgi:acyl carrier protein
MTGAPVSSNAEIRRVVLAALRQVAPEVDPATLDPSQSLRDQADVDSMDFLNLVIGLHAALGVEIPESDYARLSTLDRIVAYLHERLAQPR